MGSTRCTLQDIANKCGVSTALVSTVVNNRKSRIACAQKTREKILSAAAELKYVPNILARSMRKKRVPLVGVFLHTSYDDMIANHYVGNTIASCASILNKYNYELIFIPYNNENDQFQRMQSLISVGLLGGIITNIIHNESEKICRLLKSSNLPYMVLGKVADKETYCLYNSNRITTEKCLEFMHRKNLANCFSVELSYRNKTELIYRRMPYPSDYIWAAPEIPEAEALQNKDDSLYIFMGIKLYNDFQKHINCKNFIIMETANRKEYIPQHFNTIIKNNNNSLADNIEKHFCKWLLNNELPQMFHTPFEHAENLFEINFTT